MELKKFSMNKNLLNKINILQHRIKLLEQEEMEKKNLNLQGRTSLKMQISQEDG